MRCTFSSDVFVVLGFDADHASLSVGKLENDCSVECRPVVQVQRVAAAGLPFESHLAGIALMVWPQRVDHAGKSSVIVVELAE